MACCLDWICSLTGAYETGSFEGRSRLKAARVPYLRIRLRAEAIIDPCQPGDHGGVPCCYLRGG
jgi:hypothetical protein